MNPDQRYLTNEDIGDSDYRHLKPEDAASVSGLDAMAGGVNGRDLPTPKAAMLAFDNNKGKPDAKDS